VSVSATDAQAAVRHAGPPPPDPGPWSRRDAFALAACVLLAALVLELRLDAFGFYEDEGINLLKAVLVDGGQRLYRDVYSDQAPLFTWLLVPVGRLSGWQYQGVRQLAVTFGVLLLAGTFAVARQLGGRAAGVATVVLLLLLAPVQKFAATLVIATPALAFAVWSLFAALVSGARGSVRAAAGSGFLLALACATKAAFVYFIPAVLVALLWSSGSAGSRRRAVAWAAGLALPCLAVLTASASPLLDQVTAPHLAARQAFVEQAASARRFMLLAPGFPFLYAAALVGGLAFLRGRSEVRAVAVWLGTVLAWMLVHRPLWAHHLPDLLVPQGVLLGVVLVRATTAVRAGLGRSGGRRPALAAAASLLLVGLGLLGHLRSYDRWRRYYDNTPISELEKVASEVSRLSPPQSWIVVDRPMLAFLARRKVPPNLAMVSRKRVAAGGLEEELVRSLRTYHPVAVILCTEAFEPFGRFQSLVRASHPLVQTVSIATEFAGRQRSCRIRLRPPLARWQDHQNRPLY
jgi:hypothetical protein